jgi:hypothetical protein
VALFFAWAAAVIFSNRLRAAYQVCVSPNNATKTKDRIYFLNFPFLIDDFRLTSLLHFLLSFFIRALKIRSKNILLN